MNMKKQRFGFHPEPLLFCLGWIVLEIGGIKARKNE